MVHQGLGTVEAQRTVLYISLLAIEIGLKSQLERAGCPIGKIRAHNHNLASLLGEIDKCEVLIGNLQSTWQRGTRLRSKVVDSAIGNSTVGHMLQAEKQGASKYPNDIRYGDVLMHCPADAVAKLAEVIVNWAPNEVLDIR